MRHNSPAHSSIIKEPGHGDNGHAPVEGLVVPGVAVAAESAVFDRAVDEAQFILSEECSNKLESLISYVKMFATVGEIGYAVTGVAATLAFASREGVPITRALLERLTGLMILSIESCPDVDQIADADIGRFLVLPDRSPRTMAELLVDYAVDRVGATVVIEESRGS